MAELRGDLPGLYRVLGVGCLRSEGLLFPQLESAGARFGRELKPAHQLADIAEVTRMMDQIINEGLGSMWMGFSCCGHRGHR